MHPLLGALLIFLLRIVDVSLGTLRVMYMVRGERAKTVPLAFVESGVWVFAITRIVKQVDNPLNMLAFAAGYAAGTMVGSVGLPCSGARLHPLAGRWSTAI